jgi:hypothetical protein
MDFIIMAELPGSLSPQRLRSRRGDTLATKAAAEPDASRPVKKM